jgi:hypothetical protein
MNEALYAIDGERYVPSELTRGPWDPRAQHGGPPAALLARAIERHEDGERMFTARVSVELLRPVPLAPLALRVRWERPGKRVQLVAASLEADGVEVARATGLRIRRTQFPLSAAATRSALAPPPDRAGGRSGADAGQMSIGGIAFATHAVEHRFVAGGFDRQGPGIDWIRLRQPLVAGEPTSPLCRAVAAADFGNGISAVLSRADGFSFVNPDLSVYLHRDPEGEWICLDARTQVSELGVGMAESALWDEQGPIGRSVQALLIDRR